MDSKKPGQFRETAKKGESEYEKAQRKVLANTARLKALRLAKEAEDSAAAALKPKKARKAAGKRKLPAFERE